MDHFAYRDGHLFCEDVACRTLAHKVGTPAYIYSAGTLTEHYDKIASAFAALEPIICYSIKSCQNVSICKLLGDRGSGFDVVSGGELHRALTAGADPQKIVFAGVGKSDREIVEGIEAGIGWFNVESEQEMDNLIRLARERRRRVQTALRVNPDVDPQTHTYTTTGKKETKFGVDLERARRFLETYGRNEWVTTNGIHVHLGSPVNTVQPYVDAITKVLMLIDELKAGGHAISMVDIGGGFGAYYDTREVPSAAEYAAAIVPLLQRRNLKIILEPGRTITANAGILLTRVVYTKQSGDKQFVIIDGGMNDLIRPALYDAFHFIWPVDVSAEHVPADRSGKHDLADAVLVDIVGPVCESGDFLAKGRKLPPVARGDLIAVFSAGAYGFVMSSQYNSRPRAPEVLVQGDSFHTIRQRETYEDLLRGEV